MQHETTVLLDRSSQVDRYLLGFRLGVVQIDVPEDFPEDALVAVLTTQPLDRLLTYRAPEGGCWQGAFVEVPLGPRKVLGVVWSAGAGDYDYAKVRSVIRLLDVAPMGADMRVFLQKAADYTLTPLPAKPALRWPGAQMVRRTRRVP